MNYLFINYKIFDFYLYLVFFCDEYGCLLFYLYCGVLLLMKYVNDSYMGCQVNQVIDCMLEIIFFFIFVFFMSELFKCMIFNGDGVGWLLQYFIQCELDEGWLMIFDESLLLLIGVWFYCFGLWFNQVVECFWQYIKICNELWE